MLLVEGTIEPPVDEDRLNPVVDTDVVGIGVLDIAEDGVELAVVTGGEDVAEVGIGVHDITEDGVELAVVAGGEDVAEVAEVELVPVVLEVNNGTIWPPPTLDGMGPTEVTSLAALW